MPVDCPMNGGLTVGTGIYAAFGKDWVVAIALLLQSPSPAGWRGVALYMLNISVKEKVNPEIQLEVKPGSLWILVRCSYHWATGPAVEASLVTARLEFSTDLIQLPGRLPTICKWRSSVEGLGLVWTPDPSSCARSGVQTRYKYIIWAGNAH